MVLLSLIHFAFFLFFFSCLEDEDADLMGNDELGLLDRDDLLGSPTLQEGDGQEADSGTGEDDDDGELLQFPCCGVCVYLKSCVLIIGDDDMDMGF